jgi:cellulose synthase/poly-beta-1,6-N-acetylglucosamine synthase-like glycosyltransferase
MIYLFYISLFAIFYVYIGYPLSVAIYGRWVSRHVKKENWAPSVSILIAAYNEADCIASTIENKLHLDYPKDHLEVIVVSDGSDDGTDEIVQQYEDQGVALIRQEPRAGKTAALNKAALKARGDILVFSDANSIYDLKALKYLVMNFSDPSVGYVTGKMIYTNPDGTLIGDGCTAYMKYENRLRELETQTGSVIGVDGGIDAVRKALYQPMNPDQLPDFVLPLKVVEQGARVVFEEKAQLREASLNSPEDEYRMRVRVALRAIWALWDMRHLLSLRNFGWFAWQLWWHKVLRYGCFIFFALAWCSNLFLWNMNLFYKITFILQNLCWLSAAIPLLSKNIKIKNRLFYLCRYFALINIASAHALIKFIYGQKQVTWTPRKG